MSANTNLTCLLLAAIDGQDSDLSGYTSQQINHTLRLLVDQGYASGKPMKRVGDPEPYYTIRGLTLTTLGEYELKSLWRQ